MGFNSLDVIGSLFGEERPIDDVTGSYTVPGVGSFEFKFLDSHYLKEGIAVFRPYIRGFIVLLLVFYNANQFAKFFGIDIGIVAGGSSTSLVPVDRPGAVKGMTKR